MSQCNLLDRTSHLAPPTLKVLANPDVFSVLPTEWSTVYVSTVNVNPACAVLPILLGGEDNKGECDGDFSIEETYSPLACKHIFHKDIFNPLA